MQQEFTTHEHISADGVLKVNVPEKWAGKDVTVTLTMTDESRVLEQQDKPKNLAQALEGRIGLLSFTPSDLSSRTGEAYAEYLAEDYRSKQDSHDAM